MVAGLAVLNLTGLVLYVILSQPAFDDDDPRHQWLARQFDETRKLLEEGRNLQNGIDLSGLNDGNWTTAYVFGGYNNPLEEMVRLGAKVIEQDRRRLTDLADSGLRMTQVEEFEVMVAFVDLTGTARFIHFKRYRP